MSPPEHITSLSREELLALVGEQQRQIAELRAVNEALRAEIERLKRSAKRQAALFSRGKRVARPKRPGRKPGSGTFRYREVPPVDQLTEPPIDVPVTLPVCPACGGPLAEAGVDFAYTTDIPPRPRPTVTQYRVAVCRCTVCGTRVRGQHPAVAPDQYGVTAHRVGVRTMAAAHALHYGLGIPVRKVPKVLQALSGVELTQGAITQDALRRTTAGVGAIYQQLRTTVAEQPVVHTDDTGWRVGGEPAYLMAFETDEATVYQVRSQHRHEEVQEVVPAAYDGVMVTDRGRSYDARACDDIAQQKCLAHLLRAISDVVATKKGRARDFGERLKALLQDAMQLWRAWHAGEAPDYEAQAASLWDAVTYHLRPRILRDPDNQRLLNGIGRHHDRGNLLRFLANPRIEPTNNRAERALRPAVIARKVSHCSKNAAGAQAFEAFTSVVRTLAKQGIDSMVEGLYGIFRATTLHGSPP